MKPMKTGLLACGLVMQAFCAKAQPAGQQITDYQALQWQDAPAEHFSGKARFSRLPAIGDSDARAALVEFPAGTVTDWHSHSHGQYLVLVSGEGRTQEWGKPVQIVKAGDVVWYPPNVKHWHGAGENTAMSHIAISPKAVENKANWLEKSIFPQKAMRRHSGRTNHCRPGNWPSCPWLFMPRVAIWRR